MGMIARVRLDQGLPLPTSVLPHSGDTDNRKSVRPLLPGGKRWDLRPLASCRHALILSRLRAELKQADVYQERTLGFCADN